MTDFGVSVASHESALGWWEMAYRLPHPVLRSCVTCYTGYREGTVQPLCRREVPNGRVTLIISFGESMRLTRPGLGAPAGTFTSFVAGVDDGHVITEHAGRQHGIQVDLTPLGAYSLLGIPMRHLANTVVELVDLLGPQSEDVVAQLAEAPSWAARFALLDRVLARRLKSGPQPCPTVTWVWGEMHRTWGRVVVSELAAEVGWSRRHLTARFREQVGLPPKSLARVLRFQRALQLLGADGGNGGSGRPRADVAALCGYADQAHLNRDFRALAGCTPTQFLASRLPDGPGFTGD